ncbi:MAG: rane protein-like protein [Mycobacterium sp.]|nr:rane protein-like protein [Mycobacterium sp.]
MGWQQGAVTRWVRGRAREGVELLRQRGRKALFRAVRLTGASVAAYLVAEWLLPTYRPLLAPLTALLIVQITFFSTITDSFRRVLSVVAGVVLAVLFAAMFDFSWWSLGLLIGASIVIGQLLRLGPHLLEVPISAMLVLGVGVRGAETAAEARIIETLIGAAVGIAVNILWPPPVQIRSVGAAIHRFATDTAAFLDRIVDELQQGMIEETAPRWLDDARRLDGYVTRLDRALVQADESRRLNPRAVGTPNTGPQLRTGLDTLEHCIVAIRSLCRAIVEGARAWPAEDRERLMEVRDALATLLGDLGRAIRAFGAVLRVEVEGVEEIAHVGDADLANALDDLHRDRGVLTRLLLVDPAGDPERWQLHGALLASVDRVLRELDVDERARLRERLREDARRERARPAQAVDRLWLTTQQAAERPRRWRKAPPRRP